MIYLATLSVAGPCNVEWLDDIYLRIVWLEGAVA
jgi:hypothetical protein